AGACGVIALLISRSGLDLIRSLNRNASLLGDQTERLFCATAGISGGLLLAFGQGMWSQSVIAEVYSLNIFFQSLVLIFLYRWIRDSGNAKWLMLCAFTFGLGITNHQTLMFMGLAIAAAVLFNELDIFKYKYLPFTLGMLFIALPLTLVGVYFGNLFLQILGVVGSAALMLCIREKFLVRDFIITGVFYILLVGFNKWAAGNPEMADYMWVAGPEKAGFWIWTVYALAVPLIATFTLPNGRIVGPTFLVMFIGLGFYFYMAFSSDQNPPINWGYPRTWQGFMHAITRGQYERVKLAHVFTPRFLEQVETYLSDLRSQFYGPIALIGLLPLMFYSIIRQPAETRFLFKGRIGRFEYFFWTISWSVVINLLLILVLPNDLGLVKVMYLITVAILLIPTIKRLRDIGLNPWFSAISLVPGPNFFFFLILLTWKGTEGENENGEDPMSGKAPAANAGGAWIIITFIAFLSVGLVFMILQNPKTDIQSLFIGRVQYIQSHAIYVIWLGYGILFLMAFFETLARNNQITKIVGVAAVLLLPFSLVYKNYYNKLQLKVVGGAEQNGHDFGWQFGNWQLRGVEGIKDDMKYWYGEDTEEFKQQWAAYPNKNYPRPMGPNAVFFGGTDPGRFVPTYMIYSAKVRPDVYLITQNALADNTYMNVMRDLYGDQIWIPSPLDSNRAFQMYVQGINDGSLNAGADVITEGGKVQVQGVAGVMQINGFLSKMIFDHNQYITETKTDEKTRPVGAAVVYNDPVIDSETGLPPQRTFYVEESYVLPWMYPYLTPHGLIMQINNKPTPLTPEIIKDDTDFWNWYVDRLINDEKFTRDIVARKSFSKLRSAIAGLYAARGKPKESEAAFRQAVQLYDLSPEANFRLADLISKQGRFDEAIALFDVFLEKDPKNEKAEAFRHKLTQLKAMSARRAEIEQKVRNGKMNFQESMELIQIYYAIGNDRAAEAFARNLLKAGQLPPEGMMAIAQFMAQKRKLDIVELALKKFTAAEPQNIQGWINLAGLELALNKRGEMWGSLRKAVEVGGESARAVLRKDKRFDAVRNTAEFKKIVPPTVTPMGMGNIPGL
uniref:protein O-mannosyl-transferase family n=1 Tax=Pontiella sp. TaxID=2837462 RepID=UPI0035620452